MAQIGCGVAQIVARPHAKKQAHRGGPLPSGGKRITRVALYKWYTVYKYCMSAQLM